VACVDRLPPPAEAWHRVYEPFTDVRAALGRRVGFVDERDRL
jgi:hypothetical protein